MAKQSKFLPLYLQPDEYARLGRAAAADEREPTQQARWVLKQWLDQRDPKRSVIDTTADEEAAS